MISRRTLQFPLALLVLALIVTTLVYQFPVTSVIDVGSGREEPFIRGFSFRDNLSDGSNVRWSTGHAELHFVGIGAQDGMLTLRYAAPRPAGAARISLTANGIPKNLAIPSADFQTYEIPFTRADIGLSGDLNLVFDTDTFSQPPDPRQLGLFFDSARLQGTGAPVVPPPFALLYVSALAVLAFFIGCAWLGDERLALGVGIATIILSALSLALARIETAYFVAPLFWLLLFLFGFSYLFALALRRLTNVLPAPPLTTRTLRLLFLAMVVAFAVRMVLAVTPGYIVDVQDYIVWSYKTVTYGLGTMYSAIDGLWISDQSPGLNYILHLVGLIYRAIFAPDFLYPAVAGDPALRGLTDNPALLGDPIHRTLLRIPMLFCDVLTGALVFTAARKYLADKFAWLVACAYWFNPAVLWNGAYWGQTDAIHALLILVCFLLVIFTPRVGLAFFILGIAAFTKPQAMFFGPLLLLGAYRVGHLKGAVRAVICGALGSALLLLPVFVTGGTAGLLAYLLDAVGHHPTLSANAHNLWWMIFHDDVFIPDTAALFPGAPISFRAFSILLFAVAYLIVIVRAWKAPLVRYFSYGAFVAFAFFMLPTEIHENYGYALLPLLAVALTRDTRIVTLYLALSLTMTLNYALSDPTVYERLSLTDPHAQLAIPRWLNAVANLVIMAMWTVYLFVRRDLNASFRKLFLRSEIAK